MLVFTLPALAIALAMAIQFQITLNLVVGLMLIAVAFLNASAKVEQGLIDLHTSNGYATLDGETYPFNM